MIRVLLLTIALITIASTPAFSIGANPDPVEVKQPDGTILKVTQHGDEWFNWTTTTDGYRVVRNTKGVFEYAVVNKNGQLVPSGKKAYGKSDRTEAQRLFVKTLPLNAGVNETTILQSKKIISNPTALKSATVASAFPTTGTGKLLVILANFSDTQSTYTSESFDNLMNLPNYNGTGSFKDYYYENSNSQLSIYSTITQWVTLPNTRAYYAPESKWSEFAYDAIKAAYDAGVKFDNYDNDGDGTVEAIAIFHVGKGQESSSDLNDIWSHSYSLSSAGYSVAQRTFGAKKVNGYTVQPEFNNNTSSICNIGVLCHEFGHTLGLPDYYDTDYETNGSQDGTGKWDIMCMGAYNNSSATPAHHNPFSKAELGWLTVTTINTLGQLTLAPVTTTPLAYRIDTQTDNEYFLLENRTKTGFNASIPGEGMLVYHVDGNYIASHRAANTINTSSHQGLYLKMAGGTINSTACPYPGTANNSSFTDTSTPNALSWSSTLTNKSVTNIAVGTNKNVTFDFMSLQNGAPQAFLASAIDNQSISLTWTASLSNNPVLIAVSETGTFGTPSIGTAYAEGTPIDGGGTVIYIGAGNSYTHSSLTSKKTYYYRIWSNLESSYSPPLNANATTTALPVSAFPWVDDFEAGLSNWTQEIVTGTDSWITQTGGYSSKPSTAFSGSKNLLFFSKAYGSKAKIISPKFMAQNGDNIRIMFQQAHQVWGSDQDVLRLFVKSESASSWTELKIYNNNQMYWKHEYVEFVATEPFQIALEGTGNYGYGVVVDDVRVIKNPQTLPTAPTDFALTASTRNTLTLGWTNGSGDKTLVVCREASAQLGLPVNGTTYTASSTMSNGSTLNPSEYVVYSGTGNQVVISNLKIGTQYYLAAYSFFDADKTYQLTSANLTATTNSGNPFFTFTVTDANGNPVENASVNCADQTLLTSAAGTVSIEIPLTSARVPYAITKAGFDPSWGKKSGDLDRTIPVVLEASETVAPTITNHAVAKGQASLSWSPVIDETFDGYEPFALSIPNWTFVDNDGSPTYSIFGDLTFPNEKYTGSFIVMNPYIQSGIDVSSLPYTGMQLLGCVAATNKDNDDWLISPEIDVTGNEWLSFMAASYTDTYGLERIKVMVSETGTSTTSFSEISTTPYLQVPAAWTQYKFSLAAYAGKKIHFAINCVSSNAYLLMLDKIRVTASEPQLAPAMVNAMPANNTTKAKETSPLLAPKKSASSTLNVGSINYQVFKNGLLVKTLEGMSMTECTDDIAECGEPVYTVKTVKTTSGAEKTSLPVALTTCATIDFVVLNNGEAVPNASISFGSYAIQTDNEGKASVPEVFINEYTLNVTATGFYAYSAPLMVSETATVTVSLTVDTSTGVASLADHCTVYPNPSKGMFHIAVGNGTNGYNYSLYNMSGSKIIERKNANGTFDIDLTGKPSGIYTLEVNNGSISKSIKLIKQ